MIASATKESESRIRYYDPVGPINDTYIANYDRFSGGDTGGSTLLSFALKAKGDEVDLDASSPRLWKTSPASSPPPEFSDSHQPMSPNSRKEAIARGRKEMMEMIKDLPESFYELSLRDIVDENYSQISSHPLVDGDFADADDENKLPLMADPRKKKKMKGKKTMTTSRSFDNGGYLLKTSVFPISFSLRRNKKKKQKKNLFSNGPNPAIVAAKSSEKKLWRTKSIEESESSVGLSSSNSGSSSRSTSRSSSSSSRQGQSRRFLPGCCSFRNNYLNK